MHTHSGGGLFSFFKSLTEGRTVTREAMLPVLEKMKEHLITKNVAAEISEKLCDSVATKLEGKTIRTFSSEEGEREGKKGDGGEVGGREGMGGGAEP